MGSSIRDAALQPVRLPPESSLDNLDTDFETDVVTIKVKLCNLPPLNAIASQVLSLTADLDVDLGQISKVIEADPAFAADILFLANSSLFGFPSRMHVLRHAIAVLGLDRIKALAVTVAMRGFLGRRNPLVHQCWQHSVACALICEEISTIFNVSGDRAYTAGIMHDIGRLGLLKTYPDEMATILNGQYVDAHDVLRVERDALNVDHGRAGAWLMSTWGLPGDFGGVCEHHHDAPKSYDSELLGVVKVACNMADALGFPAVKCLQPPSYFEAASPLGPLLGRKAMPLEENLRTNVSARLAAFEG